ncbi:MAG: hypothetical protein WD049_10355 [Candidatus Paceibacterota bacterium]
MAEDRPYSRDTRGKAGPAPVAPGGVGPRLSNEADETGASRKAKKPDPESRAAESRSTESRGFARPVTIPTRRGLTRARAKTRRIQRLRRAGQKAATQTNTKSKKKLTGWKFWSVLLLAILKDIADILVTLAVVSSLLSPVMAVILTVVIVPYYFFSGVVPTTRKLVMWIATAVFAYIPLLAALPTATINVILTRVFENNDLIRSITHKASLRGNIKRAARRKAASAVSGD